MIEIIYSPYIIFSLWVLLCYQFQTHEIRLKQNDILFHSLLILKIPFSKENFNLNNKFFIVQKKLRWQNLANLLSTLNRVIMKHSWKKFLYHKIDKNWKYHKNREKFTKINKNRQKSTKIHRNRQKFTKTKIVNFYLTRLTANICIFSFCESVMFHRHVSKKWIV